MKSQQILFKILAIRRNSYILYLALHYHQMLNLLKDNEHHHVPHYRPFPHTLHLIIISIIFKR
jgi:hypothetical protein